MARSHIETQRNQPTPTSVFSTVHWPAFYDQGAGAGMGQNGSAALRTTEPLCIPSFSRSHSRTTNPYSESLFPNPQATAAYPLWSQKSGLLIPEGFGFAFGMIGGVLSSVSIV